MVWLNRDPFSLLRASGGLDGMFRVAEGLAGPLALARTQRPASARGPAIPAPTNLLVTEDAARLASLLPGYGPNDLDLSVEGRSVRVSGRRTEGDTDAGASFERSFQLPFAVDVEGVEARVDDGVLWLDIPRRADDRPARIPIAGATQPRVTVEAAAEGIVDAAMSTETTAVEGTEAPTETPADPPTSSALPRLRPRARARRIEGGLELTLEVPGARRDSITLEVEAGELHLTADTTFEPWTGSRGASAQALHQEFQLPGGYEARWALPEDVDPERAESSYDRGLLTLRVPVRAAQRHSIQVG